MEASSQPRFANALVPLRLPLAGGGTDAPSYVAQRGGDVLTCAVALYVRIFAMRPLVLAGDAETPSPEPGDAASFSARPYIEEAQRMVDAHDVAVTLLSDVPAGSGLGGSAAVAVGLLAALHGLKGQAVSAPAAAEQAWQLETQRLGRPGGKQDHYACALGGVQRLLIERNGSVSAVAHDIAPATIRELERWLLLVHTGVRRDSAVPLRAAERDAESTARLDRVRDIGTACQEALREGDIAAYARHARDHGKLKFLQPENSRWAAAHDAALAAGAEAGKIVGAGGGGFLLFLVPPDERKSVVRVAREHGLQPLSAPLDRQGLRLSTGTEREGDLQ